MAFHPLNAYANALTFGLFRLAGAEVGPVAMRVTAAVFGVLGVLAVFALGSELRRLDARRITVALPLLAAAVLATLRWHVHFSRIGIEPIIVPLVVGGGDLALCAWLAHRRMVELCRLWALAGCGHVYLPGRLDPPVFDDRLWLHIFGGTAVARRDARVKMLRRPLLGAQRLLGVALAVGLAVLLVLPLRLVLCAKS